MVLGQPPLGPLGCLTGAPWVGGPGRMSEGQNVLSPLGFRIIFHDDFDVVF